MSACPNHVSGVSGGRVPLRSYARRREEGDERQLEQIPVVTLLAVANCLDLRASQLFADTGVPSTAPPAPDDGLLRVQLRYV